jgi:hypothetical protein
MSQTIVTREDIVVNKEKGIARVLGFRKEPLLENGPCNPCRCDWLPRQCVSLGVSLTLSPALVTRLAIGMPSLTNVSLSILGHSRRGSM